MGKSKKRKYKQNEELCGKVRKRDSKESITEDNDNGINDETVKRTTANKMKRHQHGSANSASLVSNQESPASSDQQDTMEISSQKKVENQSHFHLNLNPVFAAHGPQQTRTHLQCKDINDLLLFTMLGNGKWDAPKWCELTSWKNVNCTLFIMVGGVAKEDFMMFKECFQNTGSIFPVSYPVENDGNERGFVSPLQSYLCYPMKKKTAKRKERTTIAKKILPPELVISKEQRVVNEYPVLYESSDEPYGHEMDGWVSTRKYSSYASAKTSVSEDSRMFAIDCEMCKSTEGSELTRVSVVNENLEVVYDTYVKPKAQIIDYLTEYSGITPNILKDVHTRLGDVQLKLLDTISSNDIIVGHSLEHDMRALQIYHDNFIDTSIIYGDQRGARFKPSLKVLMKEHLRREIQNNEMGHCSIEDAKACMELVQLKLEKGINFGVFTKPYESIFEAFSRVEKKSAVCDTPCVVRQHCFDYTKGVLCNSDDEVVDGAIKSLATSEFVFARLRGFERLLKDHDSSERRPAASLIKDALRKIDENIKTMTESAPSSSLIVCLFSSGFLSKRIQRLQRAKDKRRAGEVTASIRKARDCVCFIKVQA